MSEERGEFEPNEAARESWTRPKKGVTLADLAKFMEEVGGYSHPIEVDAAMYGRAIEAHREQYEEVMRRYAGARPLQPISFQRPYPGESVGLGPQPGGYCLSHATYLVPEAEAEPAEDMTEAELAARYPKVRVETHVQFKADADGAILYESLSRIISYTTPGGLG